MPKKKKVIILVLVLLLIIMGTTVAFVILSDDQPKAGDTSTVNYDPPTDEEIRAGEKQKDKIDQQEELIEQESQNPGKEKNVSVIITDAGQYDDIIEVRSFIPNHFQDGTCTITASQGITKITKETPAYKDISTTICTNPLINRSEFSSTGQWVITVDYVSAEAHGRSDPKTITIE